MKITICGSISNTPKMLEINKTLEKIGHQYIWNAGMERYANGDQELRDKIDSDHVKVKREQDTIRDYFNLIKNSDAILVCNFKKNNMPGYIGGSALMEIGFAHVLGKKIFLLYPPPELKYKDEILAVNPIIINNDLTKIK